MIRIEEIDKWDHELIRKKCRRVCWGGGLNTLGSTFEEECSYELYKIESDLKGKSPSKKKNQFTNNTVWQPESQWNGNFESFKKVGLYPCCVIFEDNVTGNLKYFIVHDTGVPPKKVKNVKSRIS